MARPKKVIDENLVRKLASIFCTNEQIALMVGCSADTIERRFAGVIKEGRSNGKMGLLRKQYEVAMSGNVGMLIWLGKQHLGQVDKQEVKNEGNQIQIVIDKTDAKL